MERKKILIVDDDSDMRIFLCNLLGNSGYATIYAGDKTEGMQKIRGEMPVLVIIAVTIPKEGGIQMYRELKEDEILKDIPVIMISTIEKKTFCFYHKFQAAFQNKGVPEPDGYLEKPLETTEVIQLVRALTAG